MARQARLVYSAYRRDDFADPDGYLLQLVSVLEDYSEEIILAVTSPKTGIQRTAKWPPSISEMIEACENEIVRQKFAPPPGLTENQLRDWKGGWRPGLPTSEELERRRMENGKNSAQTTSVDGTGARNGAQNGRLV